MLPVVEEKISLKLISQLQVDTHKDIEEITNEDAIRYLAEFREHINTDMHLPQALATLWKLLKDESISDSDKLALVEHMDTIFALDLTSEEEKEEIPEEIYALLEKKSTG